MMALGLGTGLTILGPPEVLEAAGALGNLLAVVLATLEIGFLDLKDAPVFGEAPLAEVFELLLKLVVFGSFS